MGGHQGGGEAGQRGPSEGGQGGSRARPGPWVWGVESCECTERCMHSGWAGAEAKGPGLGPETGRKPWAHSSLGKTGSRRTRGRRGCLGSRHGGDLEGTGREGDSGSSAPGTPAGATGLPSCRRKGIQQGENIPTCVASQGKKQQLKVPRSRRSHLLDFCTFQAVTQGASGFYSGSMGSKTHLWGGKYPFLPPQGMSRVLSAEAGRGREPTAWPLSHERGRQRRPKRSGSFRPVSAWESGVAEALSSWA